MSKTIYPGFEFQKNHAKSVFLNRKIPIFDGETGKHLDYHFTLISESEDELIIGSDKNLLEVLIDKDKTERIFEPTLKNQVISKKVSEGETFKYEYYFEFDSSSYSVSAGKHYHFLNIHLFQIINGKEKPIDDSSFLKRVLVPYVEKFIELLLNTDEEIKTYKENATLDIIREF